MRCPRRTGRWRREDVHPNPSSNPNPASDPRPNPNPDHDPNLKLNYLARMISQTVWAPGALRLISIDKIPKRRI